MRRLAVIRKEKGKYCVRSPDNSKWNGGCYDTKEEAEDRLKQVEFFKRQSYSYDRSKVAAGSWFSGFLPIPRRAMSGNSFTPIQLEVTSALGTYKLRASLRGTTQGTAQHVSDSIRFAMNDVDEARDQFFTLGLSNQPVRVHTKSPTQAKVDQEGLTIACETTFSFKAKANPEQAIRQAAQRLALDLSFH